MRRGGAPDATRFPDGNNARDNVRGVALTFLKSVERVAVRACDCRDSAALRDSDVR